MKKSYALILGVLICLFTVELQAQEKIKTENNSSKKRIKNGEDVVIEDYPHQADLGGCGGSILGPTWILTAEHCVGGIVGSTIGVGYTKRSDKSTGQTSVVKRVINFPCSGCDLSLLELETPLDLSGQYVKAIRYASAVVFTRGYVNKDMECYATGWGQLDPDTGVTPDNLQGALLRFGEVQLSDERIRVEETEGRMVCRGDSGGPLVVYNGDRSERILVGAVSGGEGNPCSDYGFWGNVANAASWIEEQTGIKPYSEDDTTDTQAPSDPTGLASSDIAQTTLSLSWTASTDNVGVTGYDVYQGNNVIGSVTNTSYNVTGLTPNTAYQFRVKAKDAAGNVSEFSNTASATTLDDTNDPTYCASNGQTVTDEYIGNVSLGSINNTTTGSSGGYGDYTSMSTSLSKGVSNTISITPTWTGSTYSEGYSVWIDYNQDGDFDDSGEQVWSKAASQDTSVSGSFTVPDSATNGDTRMRVSMKYNGVPASCESFSYGEVEDYTVSIGAGTDPTCTDGIQNGDETGIDCGGSCAPCDTNDDTVVYVDMPDITVSSSSTWQPFQIEIGDERYFGAWFSGNTLRLVTYGKDIICEGTSSNITLLGEGVEVGSLGNFVPDDSSFVVSSSSYTNWNGKSAYVGFNFNISGATHYGWFYVTVANDGLSYTIKDYAYNTTAGQNLTTKRPSTSKSGNGISQLHVFPNPFKESFTLNVSNIESDNFSVRVYNIQGKELISRKYSKTKTLENITIGKEMKISSGTYFIEVRTAKDSKAMQLIKH